MVALGRPAAGVFLPQKGAFGGSISLLVGVSAPLLSPFLMRAKEECEIGAWSGSLGGSERNPRNTEPHPHLNSLIPPEITFLKMEQEISGVEFGDF